MTHDLQTEEGRRAYRAELRAVGRGPRLTGFVLILASALVLTGMGQGWFALPDIAGKAAYFGLAAGWALLLAAIFMRTRYHRRRMAQE